MEKIRTLGLYQPYAGLMLYGKVETRWVREGKKPPFPLGEYVIYSTKRSYNRYELYKIAGGENYKRANDLLLTRLPEFCTGHIIATGTLYAIEPMTPEKCHSAFVEPDRKNTPFDYDAGFYVDYRFDKKTGEMVRYVLWALYFKKVRAIEPIPFKGKQGVGFLSPEIEAQIKFI